MKQGALGALGSSWQRQPLARSVARFAHAAPDVAGTHHFACHDGSGDGHDLGDVRRTAARAAALADRRGRRRSSARASSRRSATSCVDRARVLCVQRTGWGKSAVYFVATALLREAGAGPTLIVSPLLALMRNQIAAAQRLGLRAHTINSTNREEWDEVRERLAARHDRPAADQPRAAEQPALPRGDAAAVRRVGRAAGDRRGALHLRLGPRLPSGLPPGQGHARRARPRGRGARDDGHRQRPRRRRRPRAARRARRRAAALLPRPAGADQPAPGGARAAAAGPAARVARRAPAGAAGLGDRLHADQARRRAGGGVPERQRDLGAGLQRRAGHRRSDRHRGAPAAQRDQGRRRDQRAGDGLRQGRPDLRRALPGAGLGRLLLPAGRPRRARRRARRHRAAARRRGPPDPGLLHRAGVSRARAGHCGARRARGGRRAGPHARAS